MFKFTKPAALLVTSLTLCSLCHQEIVKAASQEEVQAMIEAGPKEAVHEVTNEVGTKEIENTGDYYNKSVDPLANLDQTGKLDTDPTIPTSERVVTGEFHNHTNQSNDASEAYMNFENVLDAAFRENVDQLPAEGKAFLEEGPAFDFYMTEDHLRKSPRDINGNETEVKPTWKTIQSQIEKFNELRKQGKYDGKIYYPGFEWDMFGLDHVTVAIIEDGTNRVPLEAIRHFEWLYSYDTPTSAFTDNELEVFGPRDNYKKDKTNAYDGLKWLEEKYPNSFFLVNHPSRHNGGSGVVSIADIRDMISMAPNIIAGIEGMPGNQMGGDRGEMRDIYGGADKMVAELGGVWDSLLGEGHDIFNYANSDFHFKVSSNGLYSSGYWPSEYSRNYTKVEGNTFQDISEGMKAGNSWSVYGDLISGLEFFVTADGKKAEMGDTLSVAKDTLANLTIRFKETVKNNYKPIFEGNASDESVNNHPILDHIDLIVGNIFGPIADKNYDKNPTTRIQNRFTKENWTNDQDGWHTITLPFTIDQDMYMRLRGTNNGLNTAGETDIHGNPLIDPYMEKPEGINYENPSEEDKARLRDYFNAVNDRNYRDLWFYSNPIRILVDDSTVTVPKIYETMVKDIVRKDTSVNQPIIPVKPSDPSNPVEIVDKDNKEEWNGYPVVLPPVEKVASDSIETPKTETAKPSNNTKQDQKLVISSNPELSTSNKKASILPETGESDSFAVYGLAALSILAGLGLVQKGKENN